MKERGKFDTVQTLEENKGRHSHKYLRALLQSEYQK